MEDPHGWIFSVIITMLDRVKKSVWSETRSYVTKYVSLLKYELFNLTHFYIWHVCIEYTC